MFNEIAKQFANPPKEFSPAPIWWWSGDKLEPQRLRWQMEQLITGGIYNTVILNLAPSGPLFGSDPDRPPFMSDEWWVLFEGVCKDAQELGMHLWFYDQIGFSGTNIQGEIVRHEPSFAGQSLESIIVEGDGHLELTCPSEGKPLAVAYVLLDEQGQPIGDPVSIPLNGRIAHTEVHGRKRLRLIYAITRNFDYFNPDACKRLLETIHDEFEHHVGQYFGNVIAGSFQDELPNLASWGPTFADQFERIKGYDLHNHLMALWEGEDFRSQKVRLDYHQVRAQLAEAALFRPFFEWHERHGLICGVDQQDPARAGEPNGGVRLYADYMRTHRWYGAPGSDHQGNAKIHSSLAHLYDRPRTWIEAFHSSGWGGTLEETFDWLLPWLRAGATLYNPHAVYYSTWGGWWEWAPPSTCWRQPYWRHYPLFSKAITRLCYVLSQGSHVCDIGVLYPTATVQANLTLERPLESAQNANDTYESIAGIMRYLVMKSGVLDSDRRDFDVLDDESVQGGYVEEGTLRIGSEGYSVLILPACTVLEASTAARLINFVESGGLLIAVGELPQHVIDGNTERLNALFASGKAAHALKPEDVTSILSRVPRLIDSPVPTLHRRIDGKDVVFIAAADPYASRGEDPNQNALEVNYSFDPNRYQRNMSIVVRGMSGTPQLWDALTDERTALKSTIKGDSLEVIIPFSTSPAALIVFTDEQSEVTRLRSPEFVTEIRAAWTCQLEPTLDNAYGDFAKPNYAGAPPIQTWDFAHRIEQSSQDGIHERWFDELVEDSWQLIHATYGTYGWWVGPSAESELPTPGHAQSGDGWKPAVYSLQRGIRKDSLHIPTFGPKGHVPEEFLDFDRVNTGQSVQFQTSIWMAKAQTLYLALAAPAAKSVWINGNLVGDNASGYLWVVPVQFKEGSNHFEFRLGAKGNYEQLRAYWALVTDPALFVRPERLTSGDTPKKDSRVRYLLDFDVPFEPEQFALQVSANAPCSIMFNGREVGRQGGFDPSWYNTSRTQLYKIETCNLGENTLVLEIQDMGVPAAVQADGIISGANGENVYIVSGSHWKVQRDDQPQCDVSLSERQWLDPAWSHLWRRPHPLPQAMWLEDKPTSETVVSIVPDALNGRSRYEWFRWILPPGATEMTLPMVGDICLWVNSQEVSIESTIVKLPNPDSKRRVAVLRVMSKQGQTGGGLFSGPITYLMVAGKIMLGSWHEQGLETYSGGVRYQTTLPLATDSKRPLELDLGLVRGTAEVWINGQNVGTRVWSPYRFDITQAVKHGENTIEILVLNTLAPYLNAISPTHYIRPGQIVSGLIGPVRINYPSFVT